MHHGTQGMFPNANCENLKQSNSTKDTHESRQLLLSGVTNSYYNVTFLGLMMFIDSKQKTEIHSNKTKPQGFMFKPYGLMLHGQCSQAFVPHAHMLTSLQATCKHMLKSPQAACMLQAQKASASFNQGNRPSMRGYSMLSHKHGLLLFKDMCQIFLAQWIFLCGHCH